MTVSKLDSNDDWQFGFGKQNYVSKQDEIMQNVKTRVRSFKFDWYLDTEANIDWIGLLSNRNTQTQIENEVRRVVLETDGVLAITAFDFALNRETRQATISLTVNTIYSNDSSLLFGLVS